MSLLLFVALGGYLLASRIGQPAVVGEIILGLVVGPSLLGWITYSEFVRSVAHLGAIILLFVIGLEFKLREIASWKYLVIGAFGVVVPWIGGYWLARAFDFEAYRAILIGVALTATSIAITADTLRELGRLQSSAAKAIIGAAVIDDILALLALSVGEQMASATPSGTATGLLALKAVGFLAAGILVGQFMLTRVVTAIDSSTLARKYNELVFIFAMLVAFLYAMAAELMGLSAIIGSFVAGVSLESVQLRFSKSFKEGAEYLRIVFGAIFFVSLGILADLTTFTFALAGFTLALTLVAIATKVVGCAVPARLVGMGWHDSLVVGFGMAPRGEVAMVVALLALNQGMIEQPDYVALVLMSLLTTISVPLVLRNWLYRHAGSSSQPES